MQDPHCGAFRVISYNTSQPGGPLAVTERSTSARLPQRQESGVAGGFRDYKSTYNLLGGLRGHLVQF